LSLLKEVSAPLEDEHQTAISEKSIPSEGAPGAEATDIQEFSKDEIAKYIERKFKGHGLVRLIDAVLKAQG
jgi:restriction system protein